MANRVLLALILSSASAPAFAQPALTPVAPPEPTTPTVVATPFTAPVAPWIEQQGNLRLSIACADSWASTPDQGLDVQVDGAPLDPQVVTAWGAGYLVQPGHHHVQIAVPGCDPSAFDFDADATHATHATGRLVLDDWWLGGTVGAPNGSGFGFGAWFAPSPKGPWNSVSNESATFDGNTVGGVYLSWSHEHRFFTTASDIAFAGGSTSGTVTGQSEFGGGTESSRFTGSVFDNTYQFRIGGRLPLQYVALAAGTGIGLDWWASSAQIANADLISPQASVDASFYLPMWASVTIKPTCSWGVQALAQYDLHPSSMDTNGFTFAAGVIYQPSASCWEAPGVRVSAN